MYEQAYHQSLFRFTNDLADTQHFLVVNQGNSEPTHIDLLACDNNIHNTHTIIITPSCTTEPASSFVNFTRSVCVLYPIANSEYLQCKKSFIWEFGKTLSTLSGILITNQPRMCRILETCVTHRIPTLATSAPYTHTCTSWWGWLACRKTEHSAPARPPQLSMKIKLYVESTKV